jgi:hypothetical protein
VQYHSCPAQRTIPECGLHNIIREDWGRMDACGAPDQIPPAAFSRSAAS